MYYCHSDKKIVKAFPLHLDDGQIVPICESCGATLKKANGKGEDEHLSLNAETLSHLIAERDEALALAEGRRVEAERIKVEMQARIDALEADEARLRAILETATMLLLVAREVRG